LCYPFHCFYPCEIEEKIMLYEDLSREIIGCCFEVSNELGIGFFEEVYEKALMVALRQKGLKAERQVELDVNFRGEKVGTFFADIIVEGKIILELKAVTALNNAHKAQILNYLKASNLEVGLLINFGTTKLERERYENRFYRER
jgi:GxxExxY protein